MNSITRRALPAVLITCALIAIFAVVPALRELQDKFGKIAEGNPLFAGDWSDLLGLLPFAVLAVILYMVGREVWLSGRKGTELG